MSTSLFDKELAVRILMVTSEAAPFAKSGGLADAVSALSKSLARRSHDVRIVLPYYGAPAAAPCCKLTVSMEGSSEQASVHKVELPGTSIPVYRIFHAGFFGREGIYGSKTEPDYADNAARFAFFCRAVFRLCDELGWTPDVFHSHDWPGSFCPVFKRYMEPAYKAGVSIFTIHNLGYQGVYDKSRFPCTGLPWELFHSAGFEYYDSVNILKAGIANADGLTTVSPTYSREIQLPDLGCGMDGLLRSRSGSLVGILNGVDTDEWNPETDQYIACNFSADDMSGKAVCKAALQKEFGLPVDEHVPLIGMVSRLTDQKGVGELFGPAYGSAASLCEDIRLQFVVQGSGDAWCERELEVLSQRLPNFKAKIGYSEKIAHMIEAGADFFMMPSRYEPCGLNQMYSLRYGTLPIAHRTGGLADTISNFNQDTGSGSGFLFDVLSPRSIYDTAGWAVWAWYNRREQIQAMRKRAMNLVFSWDKAALEYELLYKGVSKDLAKTGEE